MSDIITAVIIVSAIGSILGIVISAASSIFAVKQNECEEKIRECLPGANCGGCGYSGCDAYAKAIAEGKCDALNLCSAGGNETAEAIASILGKKAERIKQMTAVVKCFGNCDNAVSKYEYGGIKSCKAENQLFGGHKACRFGCIGYGDCVKACQYDAIRICGGVAVVNSDNCKACRKCIDACPKGIISLVPKDELKAAVICNNKSKGAEVRKQCTAGCIGCGKCVRSCENAAIKLENNLAVIDAEKCIGCGKCAEACPIKCIRLI